MDNYDIPPLKQTLEEIRDEYCKGVILKYISESGRIIGSVRGCLDDMNICHVGKLIVHPDFQNQGIGKALMYEIERYFPSCSKFVLFTGEETANTLHLYLKVGYKLIDRKVMDGLVMLFMEKEY